MKESKRRRSLSGAVLIMILTVMFVLIILLTATLTTVTTANQRIYTKFEENQAYYTARSALDVFTQNMLADGSYWSGKTYSHTDVSDAVNPIKTGVQMKQGLALQLDLYKINSQCETYGEDALGKAKFKFMENMDPTSAKQIFSQTNLGLSVDPTTTNTEWYNFSIEETTPLNGDSDASKKYDYIEYQVTLPTMSGGGNAGVDDYTKFVDKDSSGKQIAKIKVEVLDRIYATEPSYTKAQLEKYFNGDTSVIEDLNNDGTKNDADLMLAIAKGSRSKDFMKLRITSTVTVMETEGVAVVIVDTTKKDTPSTDRALTTTGLYQGGSSGGLFGAGGGITSLNPGNNAVGQGSTMSGPMFTVGSLEWAANPGGGYHTVNKGESIIAYGDIKFTNPARFQAVDDGVFLYAGGTLTANGSMGYDGGSKPISIVCDTLKPFQNNYNINGSVFCNKFTTTQNMTISGSVYTNNLLAEYAMVDENGNLKVSIGNANVNMWSGGNIDVVDWTGNVTASYKLSDYAGKIIPTDSSGNSASGSITSCAELKLNDFESVDKDGKKYKKINLPGNLSSGCTDRFVLIPTVQANYGEYFVDSAFDDNGDLKDGGDPGNPYSQTNINHYMLTGATLLKKYMDKEYTVNGAQPTISDMLMHDTALEDAQAFPTNGGTISLDGTDKYYVIPNGASCSGTVTVTGSTGRLIILIPENANVSFNNFLLVTDKIDQNTTTIVNGTTKAPKIDIYGGSGSNISTSNNCLFTAYFTMPTGTINEFRMGQQGVSYVDSQGASRNLTQVGIVGSVLCGDFVTQNNALSIAYLNKDSGEDNPGEPHLNVQSNTYVRS